MILCNQGKKIFESDIMEFYGILSGAEKTKKG